MTRFLPLVLLLSTAVLGGCGDRCRVFFQGATGLEIGIGTRDFISVPNGEQVSPETDAQGPHFNVALRTRGIDLNNVTVELAAFVGEEEFARQQYANRDFKCRRYGESELASLRFELDPATLPPMQNLAPPPIEDTGSFRPADTGWWVDTGWYWVDTGQYAQPDWRADVRITATITERSGRVATGETLWFIYR